MTPENFIGDKVQYDQDGTIIWGVKGESLQRILDLRGWGAIQQLFKTPKEAAEFQDELGEWIVDAINQKLNASQISAADKARMAELEAELINTKLQIEGAKIKIASSENEVERLKGLVGKAMEWVSTSTLFFDEETNSWGDLFINGIPCTTPELVEQFLKENL